MKRKIILFLAFFVFSQILFSQNLSYVRYLIDTLASKSFYGRGYVNQGEKLAADFIVKQLKKIGAEPIREENYYQEFTVGINTFPGKVALQLDGKSMVAGRDFLVLASSPTIHKDFETYFVDHNTLIDKKKKKAFLKADLSNKAVVIDTGFKDLGNPKLIEAACLVMVTDKPLTWNAADGCYPSTRPVFMLSRKSVSFPVTRVSAAVDAQFKKQYKTNNVIGTIAGKAKADSFVVFGAHYDHLGMMGNEALFPGANDNASGVAMLLDLAAYYSIPENMPEYSIVFIFFSSEELGLLGSQYFTNHPLISMKKIKFMINLDMVGTGSDGIKVVNGAVIKKEFETLSEINTRENLLKTVSPRGEAANSDHYYFYKNGVKSFFIYTLGNEYKEYHSLDDKANGLPMTMYSELFKLVTLFVKTL